MRYRMHEVLATSYRDEALASSVAHLRGIQVHIIGAAVAQYRPALPYHALRYQGRCWWRGSFILVLTVGSLVAAGFSAASAASRVFFALAVARAAVIAAVLLARSASSSAFFLRCVAFLAAFSGSLGFAPAAEQCLTRIRFLAQHKHSS